MSLLGIDVGTSGCKALVFSTDGHLLAAAYEEYDYQHSVPGEAALDARAVWGQIRHAIQQAVAGSASDPVQALCVSSLGEAVVPVSADRQILGHSILNFDARGAQYLPTLRAKLADEDLYARNGNTLGNNYTLTKLLWIKHNQPALYEQTDYFLHWSGFVAFMLGAEPVVDYSLANRTLLFDLARCDWSPELLDWAGLERAKLPPTVPSGKVIGAVAPAIATELGLPAGIPIVSGAHDQSCMATGCGVIEAGRAVYSMGTFFCATPVFTQRPDAAAMIAQGLCTEHHAVPGQYVSFIYNQGGSLVKWYRDTFAALDRQQAAATGQDIYARLIAEIPNAPSRVMALPHFTITGPPHFIADSCGLLAGLTLDTSRGEILKGLMESINFYLRSCFDSLPAGIAVDDFRAAGGGSKSDAWVQLCADTLGRPFTRLKTLEAGALGAAILAGAGSGIFSSIQDGVKTMVQYERTFQPDPTLQARYDARYARYKRLGPLLQDYLKELAAE